MNVSLTPELEDFIKHEVKSGMYQSASEVIRAGLRLLKEGQGRKPGFMVSSEQELEEKLLTGLRQLDAGHGIPGVMALKRLKAIAQKRREQNA